MSRLIRPEEKGITYTNTHRQRLENAGKFPKRVKLNADKRGYYAYLESELDQWIADRVAERDE
jgi:prophage regulatory protein